MERECQMGTSDLMSSKRNEKMQTPAVPALTNTCGNEDRQPFFNTLKDKSSRWKQNIYYLSQPLSSVEIIFNKSLA